MNSQRGFSLIEVMVVMSIMIPILGFVLSGTRSVNLAVVKDDAIAASLESLQRSVTRLAHIIRPGSLGQYRMVALDEDVTTGLASSAGEWIEPRNGVRRESIQFRATDGRLSMNAVNLSAPRVIRFLLDPSEIDNGVDDDRDGLIDEGRIMMQYDGVEVALVRNVEQCSFELNDRLLTIRIRSAARAREGRIQRFSIEEVIHLRNN
ncbi:MAG: type II secretion system protein [Planctomycetes bacterium]|nr:type II secretion system protein [Planctomycetota bacterium]